MAPIERSKFIFEPEEFKSEREQLVHFVAFSQEVLAYGAEHGRFGRVHDTLKPAIAEAIPDMNSAAEILTKTLIVSNDDSDIWKKLANAGLTGAMLKLKMIWMKGLADGFKRSLEAIPITRLRWYKKLLSGLNTLYGSLAALPGAEVLKEFKEVVEKSITSIE